jgi:large subunit ribosomal protein L10
MSKVIKQMEMTALRDTFNGVRDLVVLSIKGLDANAETSLRATLRKKNIRLRGIKNSLTRRVFAEMGMQIGEDSPFWAGPTTLAWGTSSIAELSRTLEGELRAPKTAALYKDRVTVKGAIADGQVVTFDQALKMPTRLEALGQILAAILGPAGAIAGCLTGPISQVASQIQTLAEKKEEAPAEEAAPAPAAG